LKDRWHRYSRATTSSRRWKGLRLLALRRDGFRCVQCGARGRLEVDHVLPERTHPELRWVLDNLQALCPSCHSRKTHREIGRPQKSEAAKQWAAAVMDLAARK
jgi:5-methylcytosine-specific restriction endonuclease McrA